MVMFTPALLDDTVSVGLLEHLIRYGNFDTILGPFLAHSQLKSTAYLQCVILSVCHGLLVIHADWELSGAWNPIL